MCLSFVGMYSAIFRYLSSLTMLCIMIHAYIISCRISIPYGLSHVQLYVISTLELQKHIPYPYVLLIISSLIMYLLVPLVSKCLHDVEYLGYIPSCDTPLFSKAINTFSYAFSICVAENFQFKIIEIT